MERLEFLKQMEAEFPDAFAAIGDRDKGLLHCEVAMFREYVESKMDERSAWYCERALRFVAKCLQAADQDLRNALEVSFIEDLALGKHTPQRYDIVSERAPKDVRQKMIQAHEFWK